MANYEESTNIKLDWAMPFMRTGKFPLDRSSMFSSYEDAVKYAKGDTSDPDSRGLCGSSYIGQQICVYENDEVKLYVIDQDRALKVISDNGHDEEIESLQKWMNTLTANLSRRYAYMDEQHQLQLFIHNSPLNFSDWYDTLDSSGVSTFLLATKGVPASGLVVLMPTRSPTNDAARAFILFTKNGTLHYATAMYNKVGTASRYGATSDWTETKLLDLNDIVQSEGTDETKVMSQKSVTNAINAVKTNADSGAAAATLIGINAVYPSTIDGANGFFMDNTGTPLTRQRLLANLIRTDGRNVVFTCRKTAKLNFERIMWFKSDSNASTGTYDFAWYETDGINVKSGIDRLTIANNGRFSVSEQYSVNLGPDISLDLTNTTSNQIVSIATVDDNGAPKSYSTLDIASDDDVNAMLTHILGMINAEGGN